MNIDEMSAYGISKAIADVIEQGFSYDEETGEVFFQSQDLDDLQEALEDKINSICGLVEKYNTMADGLKKRKQEIEKTQKRYEAQASNLKKYLDTLLTINGKEDGITVSDYRVSYRKTTKAEVFDEDAFDKYMNENPDLKEKYYKVSYELKKKELTDDVKKEGLEVPGFHLVQNKNIQIN